MTSFLSFLLMRFFPNYLRCSFSTLLNTNWQRRQPFYRYGLNCDRNIWVSGGKRTEVKRPKKVHTIRFPPNSVIEAKFNKRSFILIAKSLSRTTDKSPNCGMEDLSGGMESMKTEDSKTLETLKFDNIALKLLPYDNSTDPRVRRDVPRSCFTSAQPSPVDNPETIVCSSSALSLLDISEADFQTDLFAEYFAGNKLLPGSQPSAHCYCGHQFGYFSGQLGDGAAMYLGEIINNKGERWELQLKGSGPTPFSRQADGRKVLRSSLREFLCSEAMHSLGIPTTRAGSCITSDTRVVRDIFYDGNPIMERATIVSRIAPTFLRFGSFEIFKPTDKMTARAGPSFGHTDILHRMLKYTIETFFPEIHEKHQENRIEKYAEFFKEVVLRTANLVAEWQCVGFCHGVLNTDNMSIIGITIDYGPFGFMDYYNPDHICNASDDQGRYTYQNQPSICKWNLMKLSEALQDALPIDRSQEILKLYDNEFQKCYMKKMRKKLGLLRFELEEDIELVTDLFETMKETRADFTNTFRFMPKIPVKKESNERDEEVLNYLQAQCQSADDLKKVMKPNSTPQQIQLMLRMVQANPALLEQLGGGAVRQLQVELEKLEKFKDIEKLTQQEKRENDRKLWSGWIEKYRNRLSKEFEDVDTDNTDALANRVKVMNENNPRVVLRNFVAQHVIDAAEEGNYEEVRKLLKILENPFLDADESEAETRTSDVSSENQTKCHTSTSNRFDYHMTVPSWAMDLRVT